MLVIYIYIDDILIVIKSKDLLSNTLDGSQRMSEHILYCH